MPMIARLIMKTITLFVIFDFGQNSAFAELHLVPYQQSISRDGLKANYDRDFDGDGQLDRIFWTRLGYSEGGLGEVRVRYSSGRSDFVYNTPGLV